jgi:hypothetical protein
MDDLSDDIVYAMQAVKKHKNVPIAEIAQLYNVDPELLSNYSKFYSDNSGKRINIDNLLELKKLESDQRNRINTSKSIRDERVQMQQRAQREEIKVLKDRALQQMDRDREITKKLLDEVGRKKRTTHKKIKRSTRRVRCKCTK